MQVSALELHFVAGQEIEPQGFSFVMTAPVICDMGSHSHQATSHFTQ